jgi:dolichol kinase
VTAEEATGDASPAGAATARSAARREDLRRLAHAASGLLGPLALELPGRHSGDLLFGGLASLALVVEVARRTVPALQRSLGTLVGGLFRPGEEGGITGPAALAWGYAAAWLVCTPRVATAAILVAALADPVAALVGRRLGGGRRKSWQGSLACAATAWAVLAAGGRGGLAAVAGALAAAVAERAPWPGADNLLVPIAVGATLTLAGNG